MKYSSGASSKKREKKAAFVGCIWRSRRIGTAFVRRSDLIGPKMQPPKHADPELRHSNSDTLSGVTLVTVESLE